MVKVVEKANKSLYQCEACGFYYLQAEQAKQCEAWCRQHNSCNLEITSQAVTFDQAIDETVV